DYYCSSYGGSHTFIF
nr:immunoglobulin light chain junction region [Macaca mulatta]MOW03161.1 immunoglobulin light chain junction region [Macaca mulatta]MOW03500.1 immunoglobulin light chain junction region [Macaca mulatta]MOW61472.1 immunoglobulin light chain junction region [Macaca mulatta]